MTDEPVALSYEQQSWITIARELEDVLLRGNAHDRDDLESAIYLAAQHLVALVGLERGRRLEGKIAIHCDGVEKLKYFVEEVRRAPPSQERREHERRTTPRDGDDRRRKE